MRRETFRNFIFESPVGSLESAGFFCFQGEKWKKWCRKIKKSGK